VHDHPRPATYAVTNSWQGGFQADVTVANTGSSPSSSWRVNWTLPSGQSISQVWNGTLTTSGSAVAVANASYNGSLAPGARATFGFIASGSPGAAPALRCTSQ
jgi:cellulase/cellobiase CelA1